MTGYEKSIKIIENGFFSYSCKNNIYDFFNITSFVNQAGAVGSATGYSSNFQDPIFLIIGRPTGLGRLSADEPAHDCNEDNFIYVPLKEQDNNITLFTTTPYLFIPTLQWGGTDGNNMGQGGIMVREVDANGNTTPGAPYVSVYCSGSKNLEQFTIYCQYRTVASDHAHKQILAGPVPLDAPYYMYSELFLERSGDQILVYIHYRESNGGTETVIQGPSIPFSPTNFKWMFFFSGQSNWDIQQGQSMYFTGSKFRLNQANNVMTFSQNGAAKANLTGGNSGTLFTLGSEQTGVPSGLIFSNAASITSAGNLIRAASSYNGKNWLDNSGNLTGGLIFRDANGVVILHVAPGGTVSTRGGVLPNMVTQ